MCADFSAPFSVGARTKLCRRLQCSKKWSALFETQKESKLYSIAERGSIRFKHFKFPIALRSQPGGAAEHQQRNPYMPSQGVARPV